MQELKPTDIALLQALADGDTLKALAPTLNREWGTLKKRMRAIRDFLGADTTTQAVAMALRRSLIK